MKVHIKAGKKVRIEMLPLIDIVFLLLVFFIYAMLSMAVHRGMPVELPLSATSEIDGDVPISVTLEADGSVYLDKIRIFPEDLEKALISESMERKNRGILFFADRSVSYQELFRIMDHIRRAGIHKISLQAEVDQQP